MQTLCLGPVQLPASSALPLYLASIARAVERGTDLIPEITSLAHQFGFDSLTYWTSTCSTVIVEARTYEVTTRPPEWAVRYDDMAYVEIDPRLGAVLDQALPVVWDQSTWRGRTPAVDAFLDDAATFGIGSGLCVPIHDASIGVARVDFESMAQTVDPIRRTAIDKALGPLSMIARFLHDVLVIAVRVGELQSRNYGSPLSPRELECLASAAPGLAIERIASELSLTERIAKLHLCSIHAKLGSVNLEEAVAYVLKKRLIGP